MEGASALKKSGTAPSECAQVELHIVECHDLHHDPASGLSLKSPFIFVKLLQSTNYGYVRVAKSRTSVYKHALNASPKFHEQFVFPIQSKRYKLELEVYDRHAMMNRVFLGECDLDLSTLPSSHLNDLTMDIIKSAEGIKSVSGQLRAKVAIFPTPTLTLRSPEIKLTRLPKFRIGIERHEFKSGEKIRGIVYVDVGEPYPMKCIKLTLECEQRVCWLPRKERELEDFDRMVAERRKSDSEGKEPPTVLHNFEKVLDEMRPIVGDTHKSVKKSLVHPIMLGSGQHAFTFHFPIPLKVPPTLVERDGSHCSYFLSAQIEPIHGKSHKIIVPITVHNENDALISQDFTTHPSYNLYRFLKSRASIHPGITAIAVESPVRAIHFGEPFFCKILIENDTDINYSEVVMTIVERVRFVFHSELIREELHFVGEEVFDVKSSFPETAGFDLTLPMRGVIPHESDLNPTANFASSPLLAVDYFAEIAVKYEGQTIQETYFHILVSSAPYDLLRPPRLDEHEHPKLDLAHFYPGPIPDNEMQVIIIDYDKETNPPVVADDFETPKKYVYKHRPRRNTGQPGLEHRAMLEEKEKEHNDSHSLQRRTPKSEGKSDEAAAAPPSFISQVVEDTREKAKHLFVSKTDKGEGYEKAHGAKHAHFDQKKHDGYSLDEDSRADADPGSGTDTDSGGLHISLPAKVASTASHGPRVAHVTAIQEDAHSHSSDSASGSKGKHRNSRAHSHFAAAGETIATVRGATEEGHRGRAHSHSLRLEAVSDSHNSA